MKFNLFLQKNFSVCSSSDEIVSVYAQPAMEPFPWMLTKQCKRFLVCSVRDEIVSAFAQHSFGCPCNKLSKFERWLSMHKNFFGVHSVCDEIVSANARQAIKSFHVCSARACYKFQKVPKKSQIKKQFSTKNNFKKSHLIGSRLTC